ncbi:serine/threonine-protein kinase [Microbacterium sp. CJ88]|uniref:serine/threonine-protein kinase n=1 Tax=Microbacterium sp. CJ88 TaxID=3445672 RepID=UPI003F65CCC6
MGRGYRARDEVLARDVAVKLFFTDASHEADAARRVSEATVLASLNHPSIVTLYDAHVAHGDHAFLVMELIQGPTLRHQIDDAEMAATQVAAILQQLAAALAVVHAAGVVHRDIKPSNVLLRPARGGAHPFEAVLADFGVAHLIDATRLTSPGTVIGTAAYLAPEQVRGEAPIPASDIYALGLLALEALTRLHPFGEGSLQETILARLARQPPIPADLGDRWESLLSAMTSIDPVARPTADEVAVRATSLNSGLGLRRAARLSAREKAAIPETAPLTVATLPLVAEPFAAIATVEEPSASDRRNRGRVGVIVALSAVAAAVAVIFVIGIGSVLPTVAPSSPTPVAVEPSPAASSVPPEQPSAITQPSTTTVSDPAPVPPGNPNKGPGNNNGNGKGR